MSPPGSADRRHLLIDLERLLGDVRPGELVDTTLPPGSAVAGGDVGCPDNFIDRVGQPGLERRRSARRSGPTPCDSSTTTSESRRRRRRPLRYRRPSPPDSPSRAVRTLMGKRIPLLPKGFRGSCRSAGFLRTQNTPSRRLASSCTAALLPRRSPACPGLRAHNTSWTSRANLCAAAMRWGTPF